jgi:acetyl-CoA decarbonylase/synthase complex subunit alpha
MAEKGPLKISAKELTSGLVHAKDVEVFIGRLAMEEEWEPLGPTPFPSIATLRSWDHLLLSRYKPFYAPFCDYCCLCTYGKCDLSKGRLGACGLDMKAQTARIVLIACCIGAATHLSHARHMVDHLIEKYGEDYPINLGSDIAVEMPHARLITGIKPKTLGDLAFLLNYCEKQVTQCLSAAHTGQEGSYIDFESKALHVSMIDHLAMEIADVAQIVTFGFPKGDPDAPLTWVGLGVLDLSKPVVLCIGHNVSAGIEVIDYLEKSGLGGPGETVEVAGLCCTAHDITRYRDQAKIVGPISDQLRIIRSGAADAIMIDEQCIRTNVVYEAQRVKTPVIAVSDKASHGLPDVSELPIEKIVQMLGERLDARRLPARLREGGRRRGINRYKDGAHKAEVQDNTRPLADSDASLSVHLLWHLQEKLPDRPADRPSRVQRQERKLRVAVNAARRVLRLRKVRASLPEEDTSPLADRGRRPSTRSRRRSIG